MSSLTANLFSKQSPRVVNDEDSPVIGNDPVATRAWKCWKRTRDHLEKWRTEAAQSYDLVAGHQWTSDEQAVLREQLRPIVTFDRTNAIIDSVAGYQINNRQDVSYQPRTVEDVGPVQIESEAARYLRGECDAEDEETDAFVDLLITGIGCVETRMTYDEDPNGMLEVNRIDPLEMGWDPNAKKRNLSDRLWDIRGKWWDRTIARQTFPGHSFVNYGGITADMDDLLQREPIDRMAAFYYRDTGAGQVLDRHKDSVFILEFTWYDMEEHCALEHPQSGMLEEVSEETVDSIYYKFHVRGFQPPPVTYFKRKSFKRAFVYGPDTLNLGEGELEAPYPRGYQYEFMTGKRDRNKNVWFGLGRLMRDPQRWANKFFSQTMHMLNANAKGHLIHTEGAFADPSMVEKQMSRPGARIAVREGYFDQVRFENPMQMPPDIFKLTEFAIGSLRDVTGVNVEFLGQTQREQPGIVENLRKQAAMAILAPFFNSMRHYHKAGGRITLYFVTTYMSDGRLIRITGPTGAKYVPLTKRPGVDKYDTIVDESPMSTNSREGTWAVLSPLIPVLLQAGIKIPPDVLDYIPYLPVDLVQKWKQLLMPQGPVPPDPTQQAAFVAKLENMLADTAQKLAGAKHKAAMAGEVPGESARDNAELLHNMWATVQDLRLQFQQHELDKQQAQQPQQGGGNG